MRFDELDLFDAIYEVRKEMIEKGESPGAECWNTDEFSRRELCQRILKQLSMRGSVDQRLIDAWIAYRKRPKAEGTDVNKCDLTIEVARARGSKCFYAPLGGCSGEIDLDRINPGEPYSIANCVISCSFHNRKRGDMAIGAFIKSLEPIDASYGNCEPDEQTPTQL